MYETLSALRHAEQCVLFGFVVSSLQTHKARVYETLSALRHAEQCVLFEKKKKKKKKKRQIMCKCKTQRNIAVLCLQRFTRNIVHITESCVCVCVRACARVCLTVCVFKCMCI